MKATKDVKGLVAALRFANDSSVQSAAGTALVDIGNITKPDDIECILAALADSNKDVRSIAAVACHQICDPRVVTPLISVVKDTNQFWFLRWRAASRLGDIKDPRAVEPLISVLESEDQDGDTECNVRRHAAGALAEIGDPRAVEPLIAALKDDNALMRWDADEALVRIGAAAVEPLISALKDTYEVKRWMVMGEPGSDNRETYLDTVRFWAARALGQIGDPRAVKPLTVALQDRNVRVRQAASASLARITGMTAGWPAPRSQQGKWWKFWK